MKLRASKNLAISSTIGEINITDRQFLLSRKTWRRTLIRRKMDGDNLMSRFCQSGIQNVHVMLLSYEDVE